MILYFFKRRWTICPSYDIPIKTMKGGHVGDDYSIEYYWALKTHMEDDKWFQQEGHSVLTNRNLFPLPAALNFVEDDGYDLSQLPKKIVAKDFSLRFKTFQKKTANDLLIQVCYHLASHNALPMDGVRFQFEAKSICFKPMARHLFEREQVERTEAQKALEPKIKIGDMFAAEYRDGLDPWLKALCYARYFNHPQCRTGFIEVVYMYYVFHNKYF
jgi:hypothetical protein